VSRAGQTLHRNLLTYASHRPTLRRQQGSQLKRIPASPHRATSSIKHWHRRHSTTLSPRNTNSICAMNASSVFSTPRCFTI